MTISMYDKPILPDYGTVDVALATYNGAQFLNEFINSVAGQTWQNVRIVASDDASTDDTDSILRNCSMVHLAPSHARIGIIRNFENALARTTSNYVALADQDDVWQPTKVATMVSHIKAAEAIHGESTPILAFSDLAIVDSTLNTINPSFYDYTRKKREAAKLRDFVISNHIPGCCMVANRSLINASLPIPTDVRMHDWWIALVASAIGKIVYVDEPLIQYRQHDNNSVGVPARRERNKLTVQGLLSGWTLRNEGWRKSAKFSRAQLHTLQERYHDRLQSEDRALINEILNGGKSLRKLRLARGRHGEGTFGALAVIWYL